MKVKDIYQYLDEFAPFNTAYEYDNVGLLVGDMQQKISGIMLALDLTEAVIDQAIAKQANLIITHHPLIFKPLKTITTQNFSGQLLSKLIKNDIAYIAAHTNLDMAIGGVNDVLAQIVGLSKVQIVAEKKAIEVIKLAVYIPQTHTNRLLELLEELDLKFSEGYTACSFVNSGVGRFKPLAQANPYLGSKNSVASVLEDKVEFLIPQNRVQEIIERIKNIHPYEEMAYDCYQLLNFKQEIGILRVGELSKQLTVEKLSKELIGKLKLTGIRATCLQKQLKYVAVCGGSGADYIKVAAKAGADVLITGDLKYHEAQEAQNIGLAIIALGHQESEQPVLAALKMRLEQFFMENAELLTVNIAQEELVIKQL